MTRVPVRALHRLRGPGAAAVLAIAAVTSMGGGSHAATSSTVVTADIPSATVLDNDCTTEQATSLGVVQPGTYSRTATAGNVCRIGFRSSNDSARLNIRQSDGAGTAMSRKDSGGWATTIDLTHIEDLAAGSATVLYADRSRQVFKSTDGGQSWAVSWSNGLATASSTAVYAFDADHVVIAHNDGKIRSTVNGGSAWNTVATYGDDVKHFGTIDADSAWGVGANGLVTRTDDLGVTWSVQATPISTTLRGASAVGAVGWAVGDGGVVIATATGGSAWAAQASGVGTDLNDVEAIDASTAVAVGVNGAILRTTNGGTTWSAVASGTTSDLYDIVETASGDLVAGGQRGTMLRSTDGGATFIPIDSHTKQSVYLDVSGDDVVGGGDQAMVVASSDAGASFARVDYGWEVVEDIELLDRDRHVVVGRHGMIRRTTDGGVTFDDRELPIADDLQDVEIIGDGRGWVVGDAGTIWRTEDSGDSWSVATSGTATNLGGVAWVGGSTVIAAGDGGLVLRSTDDGRTWSSVASGTGQDLRAVAANRDSVAVWIVGTNGTALRSTDAGQTWSGLTTGTGEDLNEVDSGGIDVLWVAGDNEQVLRSIDGGTTWQVRDTGGIGWASIAAAGRDVAFFGGGVSRSGSTEDGLATSTYNNAASGTVSAYDALSPTFRVRAGNGGDYDVFNEPAGEVPDFAIGPNSWGTVGSTSFFGVCLQDAGGAGVIADWTVDAAGNPNECEASDADPWRAVPTAASSVARMPTAGVTATIDLVFGMRATDGMPKGRYFAGVTFEVVAPMV